MQQRNRKLRLMVQIYHLNGLRTVGFLTYCKTTQIFHIFSETASVICESMIQTSLDCNKIESVNT